MKTVLLVLGFIAMIGILTGCPSTTQPTTPTLSAHLLWQDDNGLDVSQEVRNFELIDAPDGALIQFKDGVYKSSSTKYVLKGWPEVITQESQVIQGDDGKSKMAPPEVIVAAHLIGALIYFHGYNCPTAVIEPNEFQVYLPMGPSVVTAELEVTTDSGQFVLLFHGPAFGDTDPVDDTYALTTSVQGSGTITPVGGQYDAGEVVSVTATPASGWTFGHWTVNGSQGSSNVLAQITMDSDVNLVAVFTQNAVPNTYTLSTSVQGSGSITPTNGSYPSGTVVSVTATPASGWTFGHWLVNGSQGSSNFLAQITMNSNVYLVAVFTQNNTPDPTDDTGKLVVNITTTHGLAIDVTAPDGYTYATFGGIGTISELQSIGLQVYYNAAVSGRWTDRFTIPFSGWPCSGILTDYSTSTLRFEVVANTLEGWGDPNKMVVKVDGVICPRVTDSSGNTAYQINVR